MIRFIPFETDAMKAFESDNEIGTSTFEIDGFDMTLKTLTAADDIIAEGLIRSVLNYGANRGAYIAKVESGIFENVFRKLGFKGEGILLAEIPEALTGCCCSHSN
jgi:hypothetical protein